MNKLLRAFIERDLNRERELIKQGENLNEPYNNNGWTPFLWLVKEFYEVEIVEEFIKLGGDVNQCTKENLSPLMIATIHRSSPDVIEILIQYGADVDHQDNYGHTAIMKLLKHPQLAMRKSIMQALIDNGCDLTTLRNIQCKSAMDMLLEKI